MFKPASNVTHMQTSESPFNSDRDKGSCHKLTAWTKKMFVNSHLCVSLSHSAFDVIYILREQRVTIRVMIAD